MVAPLYLSTPHKTICSFICWYKIGWWWYINKYQGTCYRRLNTMTKFWKCLILCRYIPLLLMMLLILCFSMVVLKKYVNYMLVPYQWRKMQIVRTFNARWTTVLCNNCVHTAFTYLFCIFSILVALNKYGNCTLVHVYIQWTPYTVSTFNALWASSY